VRETIMAGDHQHYSSTSSSILYMYAVSSHGVALNARVCRSLVRWSGKQCTIASGVIHLCLLQKLQDYHGQGALSAAPRHRVHRATAGRSEKTELRNKTLSPLRLNCTVTGFSFCSIGFSKMSIPLSRPSLFLLPPISHR